MAVALSLAIVYYGNFIKRKNKILKNIVCFLMFFMMLFAMKPIYAKYILTREFNFTTSSKPFYITSQISTNNVILNDNKGSLTLKIKNNDGTNFNNFDTQYEIYLEDTSRYTITTTDTNSGKLAGGALKENSITVNFVPVSGATIRVNEDVKIIVKATSPYSKQIVHEININKPDAEIAFGGLSDFRKIELADCDGYSTTHGLYSEIYAGNNDKLQYNADGSLVFDADNPILYMELDDTKSKLFDEAYSMYFTIKANTNQTGNDGYFGGTIASVGNGVNNYKCWISIYKNYLHIYSYLAGGSKSNINKELVETGFISFDISKYSNQVMNIQITATKTGKTKVYINGELQKTFTSGGADILTTHVTIGDLRPLRNLKFQGTIYDFSMYNLVLTDEQIKNNWNYAKNKWIDSN